LATGLAPTLDLFPKRTIDERYPRLGVAAVAAALLLWLVAGVVGAPRILDLHHRVVANTEARRAAVARREQIARRVEPDYQRLVAARGEIDRYLQTVVHRRLGPDPAELLTLLSRVAGHDALLLGCHLERGDGGWRGTVDGAVVAASQAAAAVAYERFLHRMEGLPGIDLHLSSRQRVPPDVGRQGHLRLTGSSTTYPFEVRLSFHDGGAV